MSAVKSTGILAASNVAVMGCQLITLHLYARRFPDEADLAVYLLAMAASVIMSPFLSLGVNDGILYYIGRQRDDKTKCLQILLTALCLLLLLGTLGLGCLALFHEHLSNLFFSESGLGSLVGFVVLLTLSRISYASFFRYLNATRRMFLPGILQLLVMGILPIVVIMVGTPLEVRWLIAETAIATFAVWLVFLLVEIIASKYTSVLKPDIKVARMLLAYGIQRVPTILGLVLLLSSPVVIAKKLHLPVEDIIVIGASMALLRMLGVTNQLMTNIMLPRISWAQAHKPHVLTRVMWILLVFAFFTGVAVSMGFLATGDTVLRLWLHRSSLGSAGVTVSLWLSAMPFVMVYFLRPTIDALHFRAYNALNVFVAVFMMGGAIALGHYVFHSSNAVGNGVLFASGCLCFLSVRTIRKLTREMFVPKISIFSARLWAGLIASVLLVSAAIVIRNHSNAGSLNAFLSIGLMGVVACCYLATAALFLRRSWINGSQEQEEAHPIMKESHT